VGKRHSHLSIKESETIGIMLAQDKSYAKAYPGQSIGYEAIYQYIYEEQVQLIPYLARSHRKRFPRGHSRKHCRSHIPRRTPLEQRPEEVNKRKVIGHFNGYYEETVYHLSPST